MKLPGIAIIVVLALLLSVALFFATGDQPSDYVSDDDGKVAQEQADRPSNAPHESVADAEQGEAVEIDVEAALKDRILGDPEAPIKISEFSSFTCSHCANFHANTYPALVESHIDTGKAYIVFSDFPLNAPALDASITARCIEDDEQYFKFVDFLFKNQNSLAFSSGYRGFLKSASEAFGLSGARFDACINNEALREGLAKGVEAASKQWNVKATPSFLINNKTLLRGALPYETFVEQIEQAVGSESSDDSES